MCTDTDVILSTDRDVKFTVYECTDDLKIIREFKGLVQLLTFKEVFHIIS